MLDLQDKQIREDIGEILKASDSAMDLVDQILTFTNQGGQEKIPLNSQKVIKQAIKLFRIFLPDTIAIRGNLSIMFGSEAQDRARCSAPHKGDSGIRT